MNFIPTFFDIIRLTNGYTFGYEISDHYKYDTLKFKKNALGPYSISFHEYLFINKFIIENNLSHCLELGTRTGISSLSAGLAVKNEGSVHTLDLNIDENYPKNNFDEIFQKHLDLTPNCEQAIKMFNSKYNLNINYMNCDWEKLNFEDHLKNLSLEKKIDVILFWEKTDFSKLSKFIEETSKYLSKSYVLFFGENIFEVPDKLDHLYKADLCHSFMGNNLRYIIYNG